MSDNTDKFDNEVEIPSEFEADKKPSKSSNVAGLFSNKKTRNIIIATTLVLGSVLVLGLLVAKGTSPQNAPLAPELTGVNAGTPPSSSLSKDVTASDSPRFDDIAQKVDAKKYDEALKNGDSVQPAAVGAYKYTPTENAAVAQAENQPTYRQAPSQPNPAEQEARKALLTSANATIARHMAIWDAPRTVKMLHGADSNIDGVINPGQSNQISAATYPQGANTTSVANQGVANQGVTLIKAGALGPIKIDIPMNTDEPNAPAVATLLGGPFSGSKLIGSYVKNGDDTITAKFTTMAVANYGISVPINAVTVNPEDKTRQGIATDVDRHLFVKYGLKPLATALSAIGQAYSRQATTTVNLNNGGVVTQAPPITGKSAGFIGAGAAAGQFSQDVSAQKVESTVSVESDVVVGVVFIEDVIYVPPLKKVIANTINK